MEVTLNIQIFAKRYVVMVLNLVEINVRMEILILEMVVMTNARLKSDSNVLKMKKQG